MKNELLRLENISVGSALNYFRLSVYEDETILLTGLSDSGIHAVAGIIDGTRKIDHGAVWVSGQRVKPSALLDHTKTRVFMLHRTYSILPHMTVSDNLVFITPFSPTKVILNKKNLDARVAEILEQFHLDISPKDRVERLSSFEIRALEVIRAIYLGARIIVLENATDILSNKDIEQFLRFIQNIRKAFKISILLITQQFEMFEGIFDRVCVMKNGGSVKNFRAFNNYNRNDIYQYMLGFPPAENTEWPESGNAVIDTTKPFVLRFDNICCRFLSGFRLSCYAGEIIRIVDHTGRGLSDIIRILLGTIPYEGSLIVPEGTFTPKDRYDTLEHGIALDLASDGDSLFRNMSWTENMAFYYNSGCNSRFFPHATSVLYDKNIHSFLQGQHGKLLDYLDPDKKLENLHTTELQELLLRYLRWFYYKQRVLFCENPFGTGDLLLRESVRKIMKQIASGGTCVVVLTGNKDEAGADDFYDYTVKL